MIIFLCFFLIIQNELPTETSGVDIASGQEFLQSRLSLVSVRKIYKVGVDGMGMHISDISKTSLKGGMFKPDWPLLLRRCCLQLNK